MTNRPLQFPGRTRKASRPCKYAYTLLVAVLCGGASGLLAATNAASVESDVARWPGPSAVSSDFHRADPPMLFQGEGGGIKTLRGIDFWITGRPSRINRELGTVVVTIAGFKSGQAPVLSDRELLTIIEDKVVAAATEVSGNAVILTRSAKTAEGATFWAYRVVAYLPEGTLADGPVRQDRTTKDADGNTVANGLEVPIKALRFPDPGKYNVNYIAGTALVNVCVGVDGSITAASIVVSSESSELDMIALKTIRETKFAAATVLGKPVSSCKDILETWRPK